jgi:hypothetical protein
MQCVVHHPQCSECPAARNRQNPRGEPGARGHRLARPIYSATAACVTRDAHKPQRGSRARSRKEQGFASVRSWVRDWGC